MWDCYFEYQIARLIADHAPISKHLAVMLQLANPRHNNRMQATRWGAAARLFILDFFAHTTWTSLVDSGYAPHRSPDPCRSPNQVPGGESKNPLLLHAKGERRHTSRLGGPVGFPTHPRHRKSAVRATHRMEVELVHRLLSHDLQRRTMALEPTLAGWPALSRASVAFGWCS